MRVWLLSFFVYSIKCNGTVCISIFSRQQPKFLALFLSFLLSIGCEIRWQPCSSYTNTTVLHTNTHHSGPNYIFPYCMHEHGASPPFPQIHKIYPLVVLFSSQTHGHTHTHATFVCFGMSCTVHNNGAMLSIGFYAYGCVCMPHTTLGTFKNGAKRNTHTHAYIDASIHNLTHMNEVSWWSMVYGGE